jgi:hypothetical protein
VKSLILGKRVEGKDPFEEIVRNKVLDSVTEDEMRK